MAKTKKPRNYKATDINRIQLDAQKKVNADLRRQIRVLRESISHLNDRLDGVG